MIKKFITVTLIIFCFALNIRAEDKAYIDDFVNFSSDLDARIGAMGSGGITATDNAGAVIHNPCLMRKLIVPTLTIGSTTLLYKTTENGFAFVRPAENYHYGIAFITTSFTPGYFIKRNDFGQEGGTFNVQDQAVIGAYSREIKLFGKKLSLGANVKYISKNVGQYSGSAFDLGLSYSAVIKKKIDFGFVIDNIIGGGIGDSKMPMRIKTAGSYKFMDDKFITTLQLDLVSGQTNYHLGAEYKAFRFISLRAGMEKSRINFGFGLKYSDYEFNFAVKNISVSASETMISTLGLNWTIGFSRLNRIKKYNAHLKVARTFLNKADYENGLKELKAAQKVLKRSKDRLEYEDISFYINNTASIYETQKKEAERLSKEAGESIGKAKKLIGEKEFELAIEELKKVSEKTEFYKEAQDLINKSRIEFEKIKKRRETGGEYARFKNEYDRAKDIHLKIELGKMLLKIKETEEMKFEIAQLTKRAETIQSTSKDLALVKRNLELINQRTQKSRANEYLRRAESYFKKGYFELALDELKSGQELLNNPKWQEKFLAQVELKVSEIKERENKKAVVKSLYQTAFNQFINENYSAANDQLKRVLEIDPTHAETKALMKRLKEMLRKKNIKLKKVERKLSMEEIKFRDAKINRLFNEGTSLYTAGKLKEARSKWEEILDLDPENTKAKRYLEVIK